MIFAAFSFAISNVGLSRIIAYSLPVLYFLYPVAIVLIALCLIEGLIGYRRPLYVWSIVGTSAAAFFDFLRALPPALQNASSWMPALCTAGEALPLASLGMGWVVPALIGFCVGALICAWQKTRSY